MSGDAAAQLACFKNWAVSQLPADTPPPSLTTAPANADTGQKSAEVLLLPAMNTEAPDGKKIGCRNTQYSEPPASGSCSAARTATPSACAATGPSA